MKILFISKYLPDDPQKVHGTFKRIATFIEAMKDIAELDVLFFAPPYYDYSRSRISELEDTISKLWKAEIVFIPVRIQYGQRVYEVDVSSKRRL
jgi:hypothetical protein